MGLEFKVAARAAREDDENRDVIEVAFPEPIGTRLASRPTTAQAEILGEAIRNTPTLAALEFVNITIGPEVADYLRNLLLDGSIERNDLIGGWGPNEDGRNEVGLVDGIIAEFSGRPTGPSTASSGSRTTGGRKSTRRTPGVGSTAS